MVVSEGKRSHLVEPDIGWAWVTAFSAFVTILLTNGSKKCLGVLLPHLQEEFSTDIWVVGFIISLGQGLGAILCPCAGAISKRITRRYTVMIFGLVTSLGIICGSLVDQFYLFAISILLTGFGVAADAVCMAVVSEYFIKYYDNVAGFAIAGIGVGIMTMPLLIQLFIDIYEWRGSMLLLGGLHLHIIVCGATLRPAKRNTLPSGIEECHPKEALSIGDALGFTLFKRIDFVLLNIISFGGGYVVTGWTLYLIPHVMDIGFSPFDGALLATVNGITHIVGCLVFPLVTRRLSSKQILYITTVSNSLSLLLDPIASAFHSYAGLVLSCACYGVGRSIFFAILTKLVNETIDADKKTIVFMWIFFSANFGAVLSGCMSGWLYDQTRSYTVSFTLLSAAPLITIFPQFIRDISQHFNGGSARHYSLISDSIDE